MKSSSEEYVKFDPPPLFLIDTEEEAYLRDIVAAPPFDESYKALKVSAERPHGIGLCSPIDCTMRSIVTDDYLYIHNFEPENGAGDVDGSPTRDLIWNGKEDPELKPY